MIPKDTTLYVADVAKSLAFYADLFGQEPAIQTPDFGLIELGHGFVWAMWQNDSVMPPIDGAINGAEYGIPLASDAELDDLVARWKATGVPVTQEPTTLGFGYTAVGLDPDGHRLRPYVPAPHLVSREDEA